MQINHDLSRRCVIQTHTLDWHASPAPGVTRRLIERDGGEAARATSIVRYEAGARFAPHSHPLGEEILVLDGVFSDEGGDYPAGSWIKNPPGSAHAPASAEGCTLFVKLRHLDPHDTQQCVLTPDARHWRPGLVPGLSVCPLAEFGTTHTALVRWAPGTRFNPHQHWGGEEILVLDGVFEDEFGRYPAGTWVRSPHRSHHQPFSSEGCLIWVKVGHLGG
ncbi:cupin domain-containing protein [Niveibacterium sp. 24ML]|uniref:cupin domain-containing protein n=1 Tax=Niveibacterium sp. 24ML TaxID=2985512 RepID=UPI00226E40A3|nr:cupin domain-containing protein [Niveibacterium sp. 24ML]MCX9158003.1 cupin domain-containing protein [Niveibacterium sp. 24ML]